MKRFSYRIIAAVCFVPLLVVSFTTLIANLKNGGPDIPAYVIAASLIPVAAAALIALGALLGKPVLTGIGSLIELALQVIPIINYIELLPGMPDTVRANIQRIVIYDIITVLAFLALALGCFIRRRALPLCIASAVLYLARTIFLFTMLTTTGSKLPGTVTAIGFMAGVVLLGLYISERQKQS